MTRTEALALALCVMVLGGVGLLTYRAESQPLTTGKTPVALRGVSTIQHHLKVDNSTNPQRTEIGCEADQLGSGGSSAVNGVQISGAPSGSPAVITGAPCSGGDTVAGIAVQAAVSGTVYIGQPTNYTQISGITAISGPVTIGRSGTQFSYAKTGTCTVSAPTSITPFSESVGQSTCTASGVVSGDRVIVGISGGLEANLVLKSWTPGAGAITFRYLCAISAPSTCPATALQTYWWWAITP